MGAPIPSPIDFGKPPQQRWVAARFLLDPRHLFGGKRFVEVGFQFQVGIRQSRAFGQSCWSSGNRSFGKFNFFIARRS